MKYEVVFSFNKLNKYQPVRRVEAASPILAAQAVQLELFKEFCDMFEGYTPQYQAHLVDRAYNQHDLTIRGLFASRITVYDTNGRGVYSGYIDFITYYRMWLAAQAYKEF